MQITKIEIQNFRSVRNLIIRPAELAVLVGRNDSGKSNVLRALNLFFNGQTNPDELLNFETDHNAYNIPNRQAKEISIKLDISLPEGYRETNGDLVVWEKCWRQGQLVPFRTKYEGRRLRKNRRGTTIADPVEIPVRSRLHTLLRHINYVYVPAIKDTRYFAELRANIYNTVAETATQSFHESSQEFERSISDHLIDLTDDITKTLGFESRLALPRDLSHVFESLDFLSSGTDISLNARGDGIKARHIPMILRFMAEKKRSLQVRGAVPHIFIWGYEEPENNLELASCIELADQFRDYIQREISQILLTTHSPVFYNLRTVRDGSEKGISCHHMLLDNGDDGTQELTDPSSLDERMGTMTLFAPMVLELESRVRMQEHAKRNAEELAAAGRRKLFVEGPPDKLIMEKSLSVFAPNYVTDIDVETIENGGGWSYVVDMLQGWRSVNKRIVEAPRAAGLVDGDEDAARARSEWNRVEDNVLSAKCFQLQAPAHLHRPLRLGFRIPLDLEALYDHQAWLWAEENGRLENRDRLDRIIPEELNQRILLDDSTLLETLEDDWSIYVLKQFSQGAKMPTARYYNDMNDADFRIRMACVEGLVNDIIAYLFQ